MRAIAAVLVLAACGSPPPRRTPSPGPASGAWTWTASAGGSWRLPRSATDVVIADDGHALVQVGVRELAAVDLATGAVGPVTEVVPPPGAIEAMARLGDRVVAIGTAGGAPAAWTITASPLVATAVTLTDPEPTSPARSAAAVVVSPDGARVVTCTTTRWPTVRDAATFAVVRVFKDVADCREPHFADADHVVIAGSSPRVLAVATGAVTVIAPRAPITFAGPGGRALLVQEYGRLRFTDGAGRYEGEAHGYGAPQWIPDGSGVITTSPGQITVHTPRQTRPIALPVRELMRLALVGGTAIVLGAPYGLLAVDLATGKIRTVDGNLGPIERVAPRAGAVIVASDRLRAWRDGRLIANGEPGVIDFAADPPGAPVLAIGQGTILAWDPHTGARRVVHDLEASSYRIARAGDRVVFEDGTALWRARGTRKPQRWFRYRDDFTLEAIDAASGRVAWTYAFAYHVADVDRGLMWSFTAGNCTAGGAIALDPGRPRAVVEAGGGELQVFDLARRRPLGGFDVPDADVRAWTFAGRTGEVVMVEDGAVIVVDPDRHTAVSWAVTMPTPPVEVGVDAAGREVAVGYADGAVVWATIAGIKAHGVPRQVIAHPPVDPGCDLETADLDDLVIGGGDDNGPDADADECSDTNDDPDDDCWLVYGTPGDP